MAAPPARNSLLFLAVLAFLAGNFLVIRVLKREFALTRMKGEFIDLVSHELRTPLTALSLKAEMLAHGAVPEEKREAYAKALHAETNKLTTLVQQVLDFARLEKGRVALSFEEVPARSLLAQGLNEGRAAIADAEQTINVDVPRDLPLLHVDKAVLTRALRNLLENASKYAPKGSAVTLSAKLEHDRIRIEVKDEGGGIPRSERRRIFQAFERGSQVKSRNRPGSGLGLAIVEEAVRAHAGTVAVQDGDHGGSVFVLEFPVSGGRG